MATQARVAGTVKIDGVAAARDVIVIKDDPAGRQVVADGQSASDGTFDITYNDWAGSVVVLALDEYGDEFAAEAALSVGHVVHPATPNGYVYKVTAAGTTGAEEPAWSTSGSVISGSVTFNALPYYRPVASGPLQGLVEAGEWSPTDANASRWFDASAQEGIEVTAGKVVKIKDLAGDNLDAIQASPSMQFKVEPAPVNGLTVIGWSGGNNSYAIPAAVGTFDIMLLVYAPSAQQNFSLFGNGSDAYLPIADKVSSSSWYRDVGTPSMEVDGEAYPVSSRYDAYDAIVQDRWLIATYRNVDLILVNKLFQGAVTGWQFEGQFAEAVWSKSGGFSLTEKQELEGYLAHKWGIADNLDPSHPYRAAPPSFGG